MLMQESPFQSLLGSNCCHFRFFRFFLFLPKLFLRRVLGYFSWPTFRTRTHNNDDIQGGDSIMSLFLRLQFPELCISIDSHARLLSSHRPTYQPSIFDGRDQRYYFASNSPSKLTMPHYPPNPQVKLNLVCAFVINV